MPSLKHKYDGISQSATTPKRSRGRPRKGQARRSEMSGETPENRKTTTHVSPLDDLGELGLLEGMTEPRRLQRRKAPAPSKQITHPNDVHQGNAQGLQPGLKMNEKENKSQEVNGLKRKMDTASAPDKTQRVKKSRIVASSPHRDANQTLVPTAPHAQEHSNKNLHPNYENTLGSGNVSMSETSPSLSIQCNDKFASQPIANSSGEKSTQSQLMRSDQFSDPTIEHCDFDSILESEGFSMISVSTLPSGKVGPNNTNNNRQGNAGHPNLGTSLENGNLRTVLSPYLQRSSEAAAQYQSEVPSRNQGEVLSVSAVTNFERLDSRQTLHISSESSNLPLVRPVASHDAPRVLDETINSTPKIIRVVRAGTVLQGVMGPQELSDMSLKRANQELNSSKSPGTGHESESKNLFDGFGAGTQRELRAGLRLGEELAKSLAGRTSQTSLRNTVLEHNASIRTTNLDSSGLSRPKEDSGDSLAFSTAGQNVFYPVISNQQLPSPDRSEVDADEDQMSLDADASTQVEESVGENPDMPSYEDIDEISHISHNRTMEREAEWQREREEVVKQIEMANSSRIIVIDGDTELQDEQPFQAGEMEGNEDSDIWQAEARSSDADLNSSDHRPHSNTQNQVSKPRRSQIPSSWRRQEGLAPAVQGDIGSDLFWQPRRVATTQIETNEERNSDGDASNSNRAVKLRELHKSSHSSQRDKNSGAITEPNPSRTDDLYTSCPDDLPDSDIDGRCVETQGPVIVPDSIEREELTACPHNGTVDSLQTRSTQISVRQTKVRKFSKPIGQSRAPSTSKSVAATTSTSWLNYVTSFLPSWNQPTPPKPLPCLPNGQRRLPTAISEGPLCIYLPWTLDHWKALYVHYAAAREGRATFRFNRSGPTAWHVGVSHRYRQWRKPITEEDSAIADAFLSDLRRRGTGAPPHSGVLIDDYKVLGMLFYIWKAGVMNGDCEAGVGTTGWQTGSEEWWRPDMESWFRG